MCIYRILNLVSVDWVKLFMPNNIYFSPEDTFSEAWEEELDWLYHVFCYLFMHCKEYLSARTILYKVVNVFLCTNISSLLLYPYHALKCLPKFLTRHIYLECFLSRKGIIAKITDMNTKRQGKALLSRECIVKRNFILNTSFSSIILLPQNII